ncbi:transcriptional regulator [Mesoflavibacter sp. CH_XMU1404-2]|uniref:GbsR/MarR family transcriptional regulator n=1 Tax=Mesoflavibacter sp. CH_XMU1404-2 TaxID=3107766 RepID=UPI00300B8154
MTKDICSKKMALVEKLGVHLEGRENLAPVAARIMAYIILTGKQGTTFDDLVTNLCASKSTISTHLNHLQDLKKLEYFTKPGDRKKYFIVNVDTMLQSIDNMLKEWKSEKELHEEIKAYKVDVNTILDQEHQFEFGYHDSSIEFLHGAILSISKLKESLINNDH